jgi:hypothetical protein
MDPVTGIPPIPAMTSDAERECYYRLTREAAGKGAIIEFGAWLGASTAYIAAAVRDAGGGKVHVYDKFQSKKGHVKKVRTFYVKRGINEADMPLGDAEPRFRQNLGPLIDHCEVHNGEIVGAKWGDEPIALIISDAPKRVPAISAVLTNFRKGFRDGTVMAWQDFCHFPSYEIPACLFRLRHHLQCVESVVPGTTLVFKVTQPWKAEQVTREAFGNWTPNEIELAWTYWLNYVPAEKAASFRCGRAMFLSDAGYKTEAVTALRRVLEEGDEATMAKWAYLRGARPDFFVRYRPLFDCVAEFEKQAA